MVREPLRLPHESHATRRGSASRRRPPPRRICDPTRRTDSRLQPQRLLAHLRSSLAEGRPQRERRSLAVALQRQKQQHRRTRGLERRGVASSCEPPGAGRPGPGGARASAVRARLPFARTKNIARRSDRSRDGARRGAARGRHHRKNARLINAPMILAAWRGIEKPAAALIEATSEEAARRQWSSNNYARSVLYNGLGRHEEARDAAWEADAA